MKRGGPGVTQQSQIAALRLVIESTGLTANTRTIALHLLALIEENGERIEELCKRVDCLGSDEEGIVRT